MSYTKTLTGSTTKAGVSYEVCYTAVALPSENATRVSLTLSYFCSAGTRTGTLAYRAVVGDVSQSSESSFSMGTSPTVFCSMPAVVLPHDTLGEADVTLYVRATLNGEAVHFVCPLEIPPISRASRPDSVPDGTLGEGYSVRFLPTDPSFSHTFTLRAGTWTYTAACTKDAVTGEETLSLTLPYEIANEEKNASSIAATLTISTFRDVLPVGEDTQSFTIRFPDCDALRPALDVTVTPVGELPEGLSGCFLQHHTPLSALLSETTRYGATIVSREALWEGEWQEIEGTAATLAAPTLFGVRALHVRVRDSRGMTAEQLLTITVIETREPHPVPVAGALRVIASRAEDGVVGENGTSLYLSFDGACTQGLGYVLQCRVRTMAQKEFGDWITLAENKAFSGTVTGLSLSRAASYAVEVSVLDALGERGTLRFVLSCEDVCFHLKRGGDGAAFGKYAEQANTLEIAPDWTLHVQGTLDARRTLYEREDGTLSAYCYGGTHVRVIFSLPVTFDGTRTLLAKAFLQEEVLPSRTLRALGVCEGGACGVELTATGELALTHLVGVTHPVTLSFVEGEIGYDLA